MSADLSRPRHCLANRVLVRLLATLALSGVTTMVAAQGFALLVTPPRFELRAKPGETLRQVLEIQNPGGTQVVFRIRTADWTLGNDFGVNFRDDLLPNSCRPWVALERRDVTIPAKGKYRFRFELQVPANASESECRFGLLIDGVDSRVNAGALSFPVGGQIGVIVYAAVGAAASKLEIVKADVITEQGRQLPMLVVRNDGTAHGRLGGSIEGVDAAGNKYDFAPLNLPVLPGETRRITLQPQVGDGAAAPKLVYPITMRGKLEVGDFVVPFEGRFEP